MRFGLVAGALILALAAACRDVVITTDPGLKAGGTIAGIVRATDGSVPLVTRRVTAIHATSGARYETTTGTNGGYTIKVPEVGRYRIEVELREGEVIAKGPGETDINNGDLDPGRDFEITIAPSGKKSSLQADIASIDQWGHEVTAPGADVAARQIYATKAIDREMLPQALETRLGAAARRVDSLSAFL